MDLEQPKIMEETSMHPGHYGSTVKFDDAESLAIFREDIIVGSGVEERFGAGLIERPFDLARFNFPAEISRLLVSKGLVTAVDLERLDSLSDLHTILPEEMRRLDDSELNAISKAFYDTDEAFLAVYRGFVAQVLRPLFGADLLFQATPTIRFHFPRPEGFLWRPRYHTDIMLGHPPQGVNIWLPCTRTFATNSMAIIPLAQSRAVLNQLDYRFDDLALRVQTDDAFAAQIAELAHPVELRPGEFLVFDGRCLHATQKNETDSTRISLDIRVLPVDTWQSMRMVYRGTGRRRMAFDRGYYYDAQFASAFASSLDAESPLP